MPRAEGNTTQNSHSSDLDESGTVASTASLGNTQNNKTGRGKALEQRPTKEVGGRDGLDPTRFGDWEKNGRCIDF